MDTDDDTGDIIEGLGAAICVILFIIVVILPVVGSAFIGSFWVFSGGVFLSFMWLAWQALMVRPRRVRSLYE